MNPFLKFLRAFQGSVLRVADFFGRGFAKFGWRILVAAGIGFFGSMAPGFLTGKWHPVLAMASGILAATVMLCVLFRPGTSTQREDISREQGRGTKRRTDSDLT